MNDVVARLWGFCHTLRHEGIDYGDYIEQITYLLFLKMADERAIELPEKTDWAYLRKQSGTELTDAYVEALRLLGRQRGILGDIFSGAQSRFGNPVNLKKLIGLIDETEWTSLDVDVKAAAFEGLLEKAAAEGKKGAGQYFTPRLLIQSIVRCMKPDPRASRDFAIGDPACGTGGFLVGAYEWFLNETKGALDRDLARRVRTQTYYGQELVPRPRRLALMNLYLHQVEPHITLGDSIYETPSSRRFDVILTNPPFGTRGANQAPDRDDFVIETSNKQLNFIQHVLTTLKPGGRAAIVVPDNVLFADQAGDVFHVLMDECDLHTILRLPRGTFHPYSPGTKTNVIFFTKGRPTEKTWVYDARANVPTITKKSRPLTAKYFEAFEECFGPDPNAQARRRTSDSADDRWRSFTLEEVRERKYKFDSLKWLRDDELDDLDELPSSEETIAEAFAKLQQMTDEFHSVAGLLADKTAADGVLPEGWRTATIESLAEPKGIAYGVLKPGPYVEHGIPMLRVGDIQDGAIVENGIYRISKTLDEEYKRTKLAGGEVVISIQGTVGRVAVVPAGLADSNVSRTIAVIRLREPRLGGWVQRALESPQIQQAMRGVVGGTTRDSLNLRDLRQIEIPVPPPDQIEAIVERVEETLRLTSSLRKQLATVSSLVERAGQAALHEAVKGEWASAATDEPHG